MSVYNIILNLTEYSKRQQVNGLYPHPNNPPSIILNPVLLLLIDS